VKASINGGLNVGFLGVVQVGGCLAAKVFLIPAHANKIVRNIKLQKFDSTQS
jgi:hypothetical protein